MWTLFISSPQRHMKTNFTDLLWLPQRLQITMLKNHFRLSNYNVVKPSIFLTKSKLFSTIILLKVFRITPLITVNVLSTFTHMTIHKCLSITPPLLSLHPPPKCLRFVQRGYATLKYNFDERPYQVKGTIDKYVTNGSWYFPFPPFCSSFYRTYNHSSICGITMRYAACIYNLLSFQR